MVFLHQPKLYLYLLTLANSGASEPEAPSVPQAPIKMIRLPGQPVTCEQAASQGHPGSALKAAEGHQGDTAQGTQLQHLSGGHGALPRLVSACTQLTRAWGRAAVLKKESRDREVSPAEAVLSPQVLLGTALGMKLPQACGCNTQEGLFAAQNWTAHLWE